MLAVRLPFETAETVAIETPASLATSLIVGKADDFFGTF
jgi:hypothetical protein